MGWFSAAKRDPTPLESVRASAKAALSSFMSERLGRYPENQTFFEMGLSRLVIGHLACESALDFMAKHPNDFSSLLIAISESPYRGLQRLFCTFQHIMVFTESIKALKQRQGWLNMVGEGACDMYSQPFSIFERHCTCYEDKQIKSPCSEDSVNLMRSINCGIDHLCVDLSCAVPHIVYVMPLFQQLQGTMNDLLPGMSDIRIVRRVLAKGWE